MRNSRKLHKIIALILVLIFFGGLQTVFLYEVNAGSNDKLVLKASSLNKGALDGSGAYYDSRKHLVISAREGFSEVELVLDEDLYVTYADVEANMTINGSKVLYLEKEDDFSSFNVDGNLNIKGGSFKGVSSSTCFSVNDNINISGGSFAIASSVSGCFYSHYGNITISGGSFNISNNNNCIFRTSKGDINITGGDFKLSSTTYDSFYAVGRMLVSGGSIVITSTKKGGIYANEGFSFTGGYIEITSSGHSANIYSNKYFEISDNCHIAQPVDGKVSNFSGDAFCIIDSTGNNAKTVILKEGASSGKYFWKNDSNGWWVENASGWYPVSQWLKIDGIWYYFGSSGYMASNEYVDGYWLNSDGSCSNEYFLTWKSNSTGWWIEDKSGWWPSAQWLKINGSWYYFDSSGYMVTNQYIDGYWIGSNGVCS